MEFRMVKSLSIFGPKVKYITCVCVIPNGEEGLFYGNRIKFVWMWEVVDKETLENGTI